MTWSTRMQEKWIALASYIASALLFLLASFSGNIRVETAQSNGLAEVQYPYSGFSFIAMLAAVGVLLFGFTLSIAVIRGRTTKLRRPLVGSALLSSGVLAILFAGFVSLVNFQDSGPRCFDGCPLFLQVYYQQVFVGSAFLAVLGFIAVFFGMCLLMRRATVIPSLRTESTSEMTSD